MGNLDEERLNFASAGWLRFLPEPAFNAYTRLWSMAINGEAMEGDLDEIGAEALDVAVLGGLDALYDAAAHGDPESPDEAQLWAKRWARFGAQAASRGLPMRTPRDAIEFMRAIGLVERVERNGRIFWQATVPVPLAEDVLDLDAKTREREAALRWQSVFRQASNRITAWLVDQRTDAPTSEVRITLTKIAGRLDLDVDETRHGLATAMDEAGDIAVTPHPENAEPDESLRIVVDWTRFDTERIVLQVRTSDDG